MPGSWLQAVPVTVTIIPGSTSLSSTSGVIKVGSAHASGDWSHLEAVMVHEWGHQVAFKYGSQVFLGAAPDGWPAPSTRPEEAWADCVSNGLTGLVDPSHGLAPCTSSGLAFTRTWLAEGPDAHRRTG